MTIIPRFSAVCAIILLASVLALPVLYGQAAAASAEGGSESSGNLTPVLEVDREAVLEKLRQKIGEQILSCTEAMEPYLRDEQLPAYLKVITAHFVGEMKFRTQMHTIRSEMDRKDPKARQAISSINEKRRKLRDQTVKAAKKTLDKKQMAALVDVLDKMIPLPPEPRQRVSGGGGGGGDFGGGGGDFGGGGFGGGGDE